MTTTINKSLLKNTGLNKLTKKIKQLIDDEILDQADIDKIDVYISSVKDFPKISNLITMKQKNKAQKTTNERVDKLYYERKVQMLEVFYFLCLIVFFSITLFTPDNPPPCHKIWNLKGWLSGF